MRPLMWLLRTRSWVSQRKCARTTSPLPMSSVSPLCAHSLPHLLLKLASRTQGVLFWEVSAFVLDVVDKRFFCIALTLSLPAQFASPVSLCSCANRCCCLRSCMPHSRMARELPITRKLPSCKSLSAMLNCFFIGVHAAPLASRTHLSS